MSHTNTTNSMSHNNTTHSMSHTNPRTEWVIERTCDDSEIADESKNRRTQWGLQVSWTHWVLQTLRTQWVWHETNELQTTLRYQMSPNNHELNASNKRQELNKSQSITHAMRHLNQTDSRSPTNTGWQRLIGYLKLQIIFCKRTTNYRDLLWKMTYKDKASHGSSPPCITISMSHLTATFSTMQWTIQITYFITNSLTNSRSPTNCTNSMSLPNASISRRYLSPTQSIIRITYFNTNSITNSTSLTNITNLRRHTNVRISRCCLPPTQSLIRIANTVTNSITNSIANWMSSWTWVDPLHALRLLHVCGLRFNTCVTNWINH